MKSNDCRSHKVNTPRGLCGTNGGTEMLGDVRVIGFKTL